MRQALLFGVNDLRVVETPDPRPGPDELLVRVTACGICPTDVRKYRHGNGLEYPFNPGHEWVGEVLEVLGDWGEVTPGTRVVGGGYRGYAEYAVLGRREKYAGALTPIPAGLADEVATFCEPLADCLHALRDQAGLAVGDTVLITGAGPMGLLLLMAARAMGVRALVSEPLAERRALAARYGAVAVLDPAAEDPGDAGRELTGGRGADAAVVAIGAQDALEQAIAAVKPRGRVVLFASFTGSGRVTVDANAIHRRETALVGSRWVGVPGDLDFTLYPVALRLLACRAVPAGDLITHRLPLERVEEGFQLVENRQALKVVVFPQGVTSRT